MRPVHQQQMYQVFTHSTRSLISIMSAVFQCVQKYAITSSVLKCAFLATNSSLRLPDLRKSRSRGEGGRTRWNILYKNNPTFDNLSRFGCSVCGKHYSTSSNLARHRQAVLRFQDFDPIPCLLNIGQILAILWFLVGIMLYYVDLILQADSPLTRGQQSKKMSRVQQSKNIVQWKDLSSWCFSGVRFHACLFHAPANARLWSPLSPVWKDLLKTVAVERTHADAHRRKAVRVSHLWKILLRQVKPESSPSDSRGYKSEKMNLCFIHKSLHSLSTATHVEKNLHSSPIWWNTKRQDVPAQQLRFWKCVCEEN